MIFVNFKTYENGTGEAALKLAEICHQVEEKTRVEIIPVVQAADIFRLTQKGFRVWAQHVDDIEYGQYTGQILPEAVVAAGARGTVLNHSENKLDLVQIEELLEKITCLGLKSLVCTQSLEEGEQIARVKPDLLAYEPSELIAGNISVSASRPEVVAEFIEKIKNIPVLIGAGIHIRKDIERGLELGAKGFLVSSDIVLAKDPEKELLDLAKGFNEI